jgi:hypothetical protein
MLAEDIIVYPNPVKGDRFTVALGLGGDARGIEVGVFNSGADRVYRGSWGPIQQTGAHLEVEGVDTWAPGIYLVWVRVHLADGSWKNYRVVKVKVL